MDNRKRFRAAVFIPVLVALLACPAWAANSGAKGSHYPGLECSGCHKVDVKSSGKKTLKTTPAGSSTGTGSPAGSQSGSTPSNGATRTR